MLFFADLHIHSKYSRATSKEMVPEMIWKWAQIKGITVVGTGDFTHPAWLKELKDKLKPCGNGLFSLKTEFSADDIPDLCRADVFFMLSAEISSIYTKYGKTRKIHSLILVPDIDDAEKIQKALSFLGNISSDGRPILGLDAKTLLDIVLDICPDALVIPAHAWTPHFSVFGSSGFDSLFECYEDRACHISAIETGLSSDPSMNRMISALDSISLVSNSDAHSPSKIGREANIINAELSYKGIINAIKTKDGFVGTVEFYPEEGKYYHDGHRACGVNFTPEDTIRHGYICPICGKKLTVGVLHRVRTLADRKRGFKPEGAPSALYLIPLIEIIGNVLNVGTNSKKAENMYWRTIRALGNELKILKDIPLDDVEKAGMSLISDAISRVRSGHVHITPGFDGSYGKIKIPGFAV